MNISRPICLALASVAAMTCFVATAQAQSRQQAPPAQPSPSQAGTATFYPGTKTSATYPLPNGTLTVNAGMPDQVQSYGPPPPFKTLDTNHNGRISETEAQAYPPLDSDFLYASGGGNSISRSQYDKWAQAGH